MSDFRPASALGSMIGRVRRSGVYRFAVLLLGLAALCSPARSGAIAPERCAPGEGLRFVCGTGAAEEMVVVPGTRWLITSGLNVGTPAHLHVVDTVTKRARALDISFAPTPTQEPGGCATPPDLSRWSTDGLAIAAGGNGTLRLFAANHGDRRAIEMFDVTIAADGPVLRWIGCASLPQGTLPNGIAAASAHEIYVTSFHAPDDPTAWSKMARREPTGSLWRWREGRGFDRVKIGPVSGANGIALSNDRRTLYLSAWSERALLVIDRTTGRSRRFRLNFLPDNIHVTGGGMLLIGGQQTTVRAIGECAAQCPQPWVVVRLDPETGRKTIVVRGRGSRPVNYACGAAEVGRNVYITLRGDDRVAYLPVAKQAKPPRAGPT